MNKYTLTAIIVVISVFLEWMTCQIVRIRKDWKEDDLVVVICSDHGSKYLSSIYNEDWMKEQGFL